MCQCFFQRVVVGFFVISCTCFPSPLVIGAGSGLGAWLNLNSNEEIPFGKSLSPHGDVSIPVGPSLWG